MVKDKLFIIDGYGQIYRSYYAFMSNPLRDRDGNNISSVFGFFSTVVMLLKQHKPKYLAVAFDSRGKTFRHNLFPEYKANRDKTPEDLHAQIPMIINILDKMKIKHYEVPGMEADDIIGTLCKSAEKLGLESVMVTADKDLLQLVNDCTSALRPPRKGEHEWSLCKEKDVEELFGVKPEQIVDYLTILGDASDNVPGVAGIGEKGAVSLLSEWGTLDKVYENLERIKPALRTKLENAISSIGLSKSLIQLKTDLFELEKDNLEEFETSEINWRAAHDEFTLLGSSRLINAISKFVSQAPVSDLDIKLKEEPSTADSDSFAVEMPQMLCVYDLKTDSDAMGLVAKGQKVFDVLLASWLLDSNAGHYEFEELSLKYLKKTLALDADEQARMQCVNSLSPLLYNELKNKSLLDLYFEMEMPLACLLSKMEKNGIRLDSACLEKYGYELSSSMKEVEKEIFKICGHQFNINSPKQLQEVLFVERNLPTGKKNHTGFSTDSDVLEALALDTVDPVPSLILKYRASSKLYNTYVSTLPTLVDKEGRIHTTFLQTGTATGRLSSKNPNLQNIPVRTDDGRRIRDAFVASDGFMLLSADYSQIELAILAHVSQDENLCNAFKKGSDVHKETAALIFSEFPEFITPAQRRIAKTINFGVIYGMSAFRLSKDLGLSRKEAQTFIDKYFEKYSGVSAFIDSTVAECERTGFVRTMMGHIRRIDDINSSNKMVRQAAQRVAVNSIIQGSAAEVMKKAMLLLDKALNEGCLKSKILLQVHDEVILEVPVKESERVTALIKQCFENAVSLSIPLRVSIENSTHWGGMH